MRAPEERRPQPWPIRIAHWAHVPLLVIMAGSGLQILAAYPRLGPRGQPFDWYPFQGVTPPAWTRLGDWLAGARHWHFAFAWFLVLNGAVYGFYLALSGEWRRRVFLPRRDARNALQTLAFYLRLRKEPPQQGLYNGLQRLAYSGALLLGLFAVLSGLVLYKPVQLRGLTALFGGYDTARAVHLVVLALFVLFTLGHLLLVALHPRALVEMVTGGSKPRA
ncbi:cytochrome b/b6 domain-containing protein [Myxococcaceae bacterium JPH2]|nr:cytochrome b/b6 domain-containing protein [Myxococcaceae bacterium JPH2]